MKRKFSLVLLLLAVWLGGARPAQAATDSKDSNITIVKKTLVAYNKGNKLNVWNTYGTGKKKTGQVKSGYKFTATGQAQYKGRTWYRISSNKWILGINTVSTSKYASIKAAAAKTTKQNKVVALAKAQVGKAYVWGATGPYSFDCSGLTMYVYKKAIGLSLPHYSVSQLYYGKAVSTKKLVKGDLLFFGSKSAPSHVGIYVGSGKFVHASSPTVGVIKSTVSTNRSSAFYPSSARRVI
ncbi:hydrolase [Lactobacillus nasalidis]|uniref:Hydrolase n=1 Tax=Lactobacillus nasalidis TaxID=2797258 RepID=A0ABQ3W7E9_9LACO|nr:C40 family peptidase [Lactobacillus nasalidis]GHV98473.1 hydrolase [Lactobacillus nasalidis]GHV99767.1 hydrolase [Lactobacillus nasalidis]GHW01275.1 hydrolase [Lactobacillus nasalidis]